MAASAWRRKSIEALIGYAPHNGTNSKLVIVMVGLPATGKSYVAKKLARYLNWLQHKTQVFNVGDRRREAAGSSSSSPEAAPHSLSTSDATFFDPTSPACVSLRDQLAINTLDELLNWLFDAGGNIGILDATNSTPTRRQLVLRHIQQRCGGSGGLRVLFLESRCSDGAIREANIRLKLSGPDYAGKDPDASLADFRRRIVHYEKAYEPLGAAEEVRGLAFVQMTDAGRKMNTHLIRGYILSQIVEYLLNFNLARRQIWLSCNGESLDDREGRIGRHSDLSDRGRQYASALAAFVEAQRRSWRAEPVSGHNPDSSQFSVWTSTWPQAVQTGTFFPSETYDQTNTKMLDDLNAGSMGGLTFEEIAEKHPDEYTARRRDKLHYRWPGLGGEGYVDLIVRLRPLIVELERTTDCLVLITHRAVVRILVSYFLGIERDGLGEVRMPKEALYCFDIEPYGISFRLFVYNPELDTFNQIPDSELPPYLTARIPPYAARRGGS
ncbi:putative bifunctional 6-phosphofructo-2-kinase fructose- -bisphosphate 2-phosphatase [Rosellinia necatrix]|uniref:Putative bifunctional 6-phosphofructo-2-kinase fructose--bisphosphate 2-phosphatase n=1 Tax=Rosellinia necatrix TaxID=77044 RepID=A0A1S7UMR5_ROSNE|nr:putative bifunctional 6-phosphofructo-2-kinase fructose- -bisphosphate 2-phosphatase [Rosellinia necatrix]